MASNVLSTDRFIDGKLRYVRKRAGSQKLVGKRAGISASTISRAERGFGVNFTSAILLGIELRILDYGVYDVNDPSIKRILSYMRVVANGGHAKGWQDYYEGVKKIIRNAA